MQHLTAQQCARAYYITYSRMASSLPLPRRTTLFLFRPRRSYSTSHLPPTPTQPSPPVPPLPPPGTDNNAFSTTFSNIRRTLTYSLVGITLLAATTLTAFEATHQWVEHVELAPDTDPENTRWGWTQEAERWSGEGGRGGTDPALGFKARHAVRGAWIALHWGSGSSRSSASVINSSLSSSSGAAKPRPVSASLELAHDFLNIALRLALQRQQDASSKLRKETIPELLTRHANILERMGSRAFLVDARAEYERVWGFTSGASRNQGVDVDAARVAAKLGDVCARLGDGEEAVEWWQRACAILVGSSSPASTSGSSSPSSKKTMTPQSSSSSPFLLPSSLSLPNSALAQRTLASLLPTLSAHCVQAGDLKEARRVQEAGLNLLLLSVTTPAIPPTANANTSPSSAETLHALYLTHRASLLSLHLAEVTYALKEDAPEQTALDRLKHAARTSEGVANALTGDESPAHSSSNGAPPAPDKALDKKYASSRTLRPPATSLLRDARRTAVEAWTLAGILCEQQQPSSPSTKPSSSFFSSQKQRDGPQNQNPEEAALECYSRALAWAGVGGDENLSGMGRPGEGTLEREWEALWARYVRVRDVVRAQQQRGLERGGKAEK